jgi:hypothetical protein
MPSPAINDAPQLLKEFGCAVNLVEDHEFIFMVFKVPVRVG